MGLITVTINVNKKINGVYRHIGFKLCKTRLEKDPQIAMFYDFFTILNVDEKAELSVLICASY